MKQILLTMLLTVYTAGALFTLGLAMLYPFAFGMKDFPAWTCWIVYPLTLIIIATMDKVHEFFNKQLLDKPRPVNSFTCKGCGHNLPMEFNVRTENYCYLCDPKVTLNECLSKEPLEHKTKK